MPTMEEAAAVAAGIRLIEKERIVVVARGIRRLKTEDDDVQSAEEVNLRGPAETKTKESSIVANSIREHFARRGKEGLLARYIKDLRSALEDEMIATSGGTKDAAKKCETRDDDEATALDLCDSDASSFDVEVIEEEEATAASEESADEKDLESVSLVEKDEVSTMADAADANDDTTCSMVRQKSSQGVNLLCPKVEMSEDPRRSYTKLPTKSPNYNSMERCTEGQAADVESTHHEEKIDVSDINYEENDPERPPSILQHIVEDFTPNKGDQKILRAIGRTATVNAAVLVTAATGGAAGAVGFATGGAITTKRLFDGLVKQDEKEVTKSLAVYGCATGASVAGQAITGALMIGVAGASLPLAGAVAFGVGCASGITAGALSEFTVDSVMDRFRGKKRGRRKTGGMERCESDGALLGKNTGVKEPDKRMDESNRRQSCRF